MNWTVKTQLNQRLMMAIQGKPLTSPGDFVLCSVGVRNFFLACKNKRSFFHDSTTHSFIAHLCLKIPQLVNTLSLQQYAHFAELHHSFYAILDKGLAPIDPVKRLAKAMQQSIQTLWKNFPQRLDKSKLFVSSFTDLKSSFLDEPFLEKIVDPTTSVRTITEFLYSAYNLLLTVEKFDGIDVDDLRTVFLLCLAAFKEVLSREIHPSGSELTNESPTPLKIQCTYFTGVMREGKRHGIMSPRDTHHCFRLLRKVLNAHVEAESSPGVPLLSRKSIRNMWQVVFSISKKQKPVSPACILHLSEITVKHLSRFQQKDIFGILCVLADRYPSIPESISTRVFTKYVSLLCTSPTVSESSGSIAEIQRMLKEMCTAFKAWYTLKIKAHNEVKFLQKRIFKSIFNLSRATKVKLSDILDIEIFHSLLFLIWKVHKEKEGERMLELLSHSAHIVLRRGDVSWVFRCVNTFARISQSKTNRKIFESVRAVMPEKIPQATHSQLISLVLFITRGAPRGEAQSLSEPIFKRLDAYLDKLLNEQAIDQSPSKQATISTHDLAVWLRFICAQNHDAPDSTVSSLLSIITSSQDAMRDPFIVVSMLYYISRYHSQLIHDTCSRDPLWLTSVLHSKSEATSVPDLLVRSLALSMDNIDHYLPKLSTTQSVFLLKSLSSLPSALSQRMERVMCHLSQIPTKGHSWNSAAILLKLMAHQHLRPRTYAVDVLDSLCHEGFRGASLRNLCDIYIVMPMMRIQPARLHRDIWLQFVNKMTGASGRQLALMLETRALYKQMNLAHILTIKECSVVHAEPEQMAAIIAACRGKIPEMTPDELVIAGGSLASLEIKPTGDIFQHFATALFLSAGEKAFSGATLSAVRIANFFRMLISCVHDHWERGESPQPDKQLSPSKRSANRRGRKSLKSHDRSSVNNGMLRSLGESADFLWLRLCAAGTMVGCVREITENFGNETHSDRFQKQIANWRVMFVGFGHFIKNLVAMDEIFRANLPSLKDYLILPVKKREVNEDPILRPFASQIEPEHVLTLITNTLWLVEKHAASTVDMDGIDRDPSTETILDVLLPPVAQKDLLTACDFLLKILHCVCHRIPVKLLEQVYAFVKAIPFSRLETSKELVLKSLNALFTVK